jgi:hypothetical protein
MIPKCPSCNSDQDARKVSAIIAEQEGMTASAKRKWFKREYSTDLAKQLKKPVDTTESTGLGYIGCGCWFILATLVNLLYFGFVIPNDKLAGFVVISLLGLTLFIIGIYIRKEYEELRKDLALNDYFFNEAAKRAWYCTKCGIRFDENGELD